MAYLERVRAKGNVYLYLKEYAVRKHYANNSIIIYRFGRIDQALKNMQNWKRNYSLFPIKLKKMGFNKKDLMIWIETLESGVHKTGRVFESVK